MNSLPVEGLQAVADGLERRRSASAATPGHQGLSASPGIRSHRRKCGASSYLGPWNGGMLTTAGNLVVQGDAAGNFNVYRADSGEKLWSTRRRRAVMAGPVTYEVNGEQYIAVMAGWGGGFPLLEGKEAAKSGNLRNVSRVLAFKVGGTATLPAAAAGGEARARIRRRRPPIAATVARGEHLFGQYCSVCHGESAVGGGVVPDLRASSFLGNDFWYEIVLNGAMKDAGMAPFKAVLDQKDAEAIRAYVIHRANEDKSAAANGSALQ